MVVMLVPFPIVQPRNLRIGVQRQSLQGHVETDSKHRRFSSQGRWSLNLVSGCLFCCCFFLPRVERPTHSQLTEAIQVSVGGCFVFKRWAEELQSKSQLLSIVNINPQRLSSGFLCVCPIRILMLEGGSFVGSLFHLALGYQCSSVPPFWYHIPL